jgi:hypothetical protein
MEASAVTTLSEFKSDKPKLNQAMPEVMKHMDGLFGASLARAARSWRVEGRAPSGQREGVQRINPLARVWAGVRPSSAGKESARSARNFGQGQPPAGRL